MREFIYKKITFLLTIFAFVSLIAIPAWSAVTSVTCTTKTAVQLGGKDYIKCQGSMNGMVPSNGDTYKTPLTILYPAKKGNGRAIVQPRCYTLQEASYNDSDPNNRSMATISCGDKVFTDRFIGERGYTYVDLQWNKYVLDAAADIGGAALNAFTNGYKKNDIQNPMDAHQILADVNDMLRNGFIKDAPAVNKVILSATSGGNGIAREYLLHQQHAINPDNTPTYPHTFAYDGYLQVSLGPSCIDLHFNTMNDPLEAYTFCPEPMTGTGGVIEKMIVFNSETDLQIFGGGFMRVEDLNDPSYRFYETPGAHLPKNLIDVEELFPDIVPLPNFRQNVANTYKPVPAMVENLFAWIDGTLPPPSVALSGLTSQPIYTGIPCSPFLGPDLAGVPVCDQFGNSPLFAGGGLDVVFDCARDDDGNALAGIRLPYIQVPLGEYNGNEEGIFNQQTASFQLPPELRPEWQRILAWEVGGFYNRFDNSTLNNLYSNNRIYVTKVAAAALNALAHRWILPEDVADYVWTAKNCVVGTKSAYTDADLEACHGIFF
jgi:hypothetical protein